MKGSPPSIQSSTEIRDYGRMPLSCVSPDYSAPVHPFWLYPSECSTPWFLLLPSRFDGLFHDDRLLPSDCGVQGAMSNRCHDRCRHVQCSQLFPCQPIVALCYFSTPNRPLANQYSLDNRLFLVFLVRLHVRVVNRNRYFPYDPCPATLPISSRIIYGHSSGEFKCRIFLGTATDAGVRRKWHSECPGSGEEHEDKRYVMAVTYDE